MRLFLDILSNVWRIEYVTCIPIPYLMVIQLFTIGYLIQKKRNVVNFWSILFINTSCSWSFSIAF